MQDLKETVRPFYTQLLTAHGTADANALIDRLIADDYQHINTAETLDKAHFRQHVPGLWQLIPNLKCEIQEMLQEGNEVVVRCIVSGNPVGDFMGLTLDGSKSFSVLTIDIHTVTNGQIAKVYHLEEWTTAMRQLQG